MENEKLERKELAIARHFFRAYIRHIEAVYDDDDLFKHFYLYHRCFALPFPRLFLELYY